MVYSGSQQLSRLISRRAFAALLASAAPALHAACASPAFGSDTDVAPSDANHFPKLSFQSDWPWWRGPLRNGHTPSDCQLPTRFGESERVVWKVRLPGRGHSSPVVVGDAVYLTTADEKNETQSMLAFDRNDGRLLWTREISQGGFTEKNHEKNSEATPTIACDGEHVIATFFHHKGIHVVALDVGGREVWKRRLGDFNPRKYEYGYAPSPVMYRQSVIIAAEQDGESYIAALNRENGNELWRTPRPQSISYSSPSIGHVAGRDQLLISGHEHVAAYDPADGRQLWRAPGTTAATCGTAVWAGDIALASGGFPKAETVAIRADGSQKVLWKNPQKCYEQSMIVFRSNDDKADHYLVALTDNGIAFCWRVSDGQEMWKQRLRGPVSASPILAGGNIYWANENGTMYVIAADPSEFRLVAENRLGTESMASPAVSRNQMFLRVAHGSGASRVEHLFCIG